MADLPTDQVQWDAMTIPSTLARAARMWPDVSALEDGDKSFTFRELEAAAQEACRAFIACGVERGDRVAIWAPNGWRWEVAALGLQSAGAVLVTLNTRFKASEAAYVLSKSGAKLLFTMGDFLGMNYADAIASEDLPALQATVLIGGHSDTETGNTKSAVTESTVTEIGNAESWDAFLARGEAVPAGDARARADAVEPDDLSDFIFTSGTTGNPKAVTTAHGQNLKVFDIWGRSVGLSPGDRYLIVMPFFHSFGYKSGWLACIIHGATALPESVFDVGAALERIERDKVTVMPGSPTIYQSMLTFPDREKYDTSSLRLAVTGGAAVPVELVRQMRNELGFREVITAYGLTESSGTVTACRLGDDDETIATTCGRPIPDTETKIMNADGKEVPAGEPGEIWTRGYHVMKGYWDDPIETAKAIDAEGWLHTGDIGVMDERGYLRITDRIKDMFIMGGFNVYPAEVENLLFQHDGIAAAAVIGVPDERMGEVGMAFVVPMPGAALDRDALVAWSRDNMANYKVPRFFEIVDALPANASGKVLKNDLRDRAKALIA